MLPVAAGLWADRTVFVVTSQHNFVGGGVQRESFVTHTAVLYLMTKRLYSCQVCAFDAFRIRAGVSSFIKPGFLRLPQLACFLVSHAGELLGVGALKLVVELAKPFNATYVRFDRRQRTNRA